MGTATTEGRVSWVMAKGAAGSAAEAEGMMEVLRGEVEAMTAVADVEVMDGVEARTAVADRLAMEMETEAAGLVVEAAAQLAAVAQA